MGRFPFRLNWKRMRLARPERLFERAPKLRAFDLANTGEERYVGEIFHAGVRALTRERVRVELLGDMSLDRVEAERGRRDPGEPEDIVSNDDIGLAEDGVGERDVEPEGLTVGLARQRAGHAVSLTFVNHSFVRDLGMLGVGRDREHHELAEIQAGRALKPFENPGGRTESRRSMSLVVRARSTRSSTTRPPLI